MHDRNALMDLVPPPLSRKRQLLGILLPLVVLTCGALLALWLMKTSPKAKSKPPARAATLVEVTPVVFKDHSALINAMGLVQAAQRIVLQPRVNGEVVEISDEFVPGGIFNVGETMLRVDPTDYELVVRQITRAVAQAEADLRVEEGSQTVAKKDFELLGELVNEKDRDLVLRKPQLETARAALDAARSQLDKARLDLQRTTIAAPFNAVVQARDVNIGARVGENTALATLIGTDTYWVEATVPVNQLRWIKIPSRDAGEGSLVRIYNEAAWGAGAFRTGQVFRMTADLEQQGRMARLLIAVDDPLSLKEENEGKPVLLIGSYVRTEIEGVTLNSVAVVDRGLLRENDRVWVKTPADKLDIRPVEVAFRGRDEVLITGGLQAGEQIVTTDLAAAVKGMPLRIEAPRAAPGAVLQTGLKQNPE